MQQEHCESRATVSVGAAQYWTAGAFCMFFLLATILLLPMLTMALPPMPGIVALTQSALVTIYAVTSALLFAQFAQTRAIPVLFLAAGSLYTTGIVLTQLLCFPNVLTPGLLIGQGPDTLIWLWTFWHLGPPLFALPFAIMQGGIRARTARPGHVARTAWLAAAGAISAVLAVGVLVTAYVEALPKSTEGDNYWLLTASGVGPALEMLTILSLVALCWATKLRTVLQLWLAVSLFMLVLDNLVTDIGAARNTVGWVVGRVEALLAGGAMLAVFLLELDALRRRAETNATERGVAHLEAQSARDSLALALEASGMGDWELDLLTDSARRTLHHDQIFGYAALLPRWGWSDLLGHVLPQDRARAEAAFDSALVNGRLEIEARIRRAGDNEIRWIEILGKTYYDATNQATTMAGCLMDTTERHLTEDRSRQAERMESVGQLTGGVAHDFNNLLTVIIGSLEMIQRAPARADRVERFANGALAAAQRGAELTGKLLSFSRRQVVRPEIASLGHLLEALLPTLERMAGDTVNLDLRLDPRLEMARLDPRQFEAALINVVANACDAMPSGGRLTISTGTVVLAAPEAQCHDLEPGAYLSVCISDTGVGMDQSALRLAFEPFFTTKDIGKGAGLGLSQVYGFAKQAGGAARIVSQLGKGTQVELLLPRSTIQAGILSAPLPDKLPLPRATPGEVVLVVEDDPDVLDVTVEALHELGYKTLTAISASHALDRLRSPERIDVMFSDVVMPGGMNGVQLAVVARTIRDRLKVVLASGYTASALSDDQEMPEGTPLLSKPYAQDDLAQTLQTVLHPPAQKRWLTPV